MMLEMEMTDGGKEARGTAEDSSGEMKSGRVSWRAGEVTPYRFQRFQFVPLDWYDSFHSHSETNCPAVTLG